MNWRATAAAIALSAGLAMASALGSATLPTRAQGVVNFDIDPDTTGNGANTLGTTENCVEVTVPSPAFDDTSDYNIDIVVTGDTLAPVDYYTELVYDAAKVHIADPGTNDVIKMPGVAMTLSEARPGSDGAHSFGAMYLIHGDAGTPGDGTLVRVGLDIGGSGLVTFTLNEPPEAAYTSVAGPHTVTLGRGYLAVNTDCPAVGGVAELPSVSDSSDPNYAAPAGLAAAGLLALAAGAWYARRRWISRS